MLHPVIRHLVKPVIIALALYQGEDGGTHMGQIKLQFSVIIALYIQLLLSKYLLNFYCGLALP